MSLSYARGCVRACGCGRARAAIDAAMPAGQVAYGVRQVDAPGHTQENKNGSGDLAGDAVDGGEGGGGEEGWKDGGEEWVGLVVDRAYVEGDEVCGWCAGGGGCGFVCRVLICDVWGTRSDVCACMCVYVGRFVGVCVCVCVCLGASGVQVTYVE